MIGQIGYLGQVSPWAGQRAAGLYALGCTLGGAAAGGILGSCGYGFLWLAGLPAGPGGRAALLPVGLLMLIGALRDLRLLAVRLPQPACQVPRDWLPAWGPQRAAVLWGLCIGAGIRTRYTYSILHVLGVWVLFSGTPLWGAGVLGVYGAAHGLAAASAMALLRHGRARPVVEALPQWSNLAFAFSGACLAGLGPVLLLHALR